MDDRLQRHRKETPELDKQAHATAGSEEVILETKVLSANDEIAQKNRALLTSKHVLTLNLISSPGAGKTSLLVETGVPAVQINTRSACDKTGCVAGQEQGQAADLFRLPPTIHHSHLAPLSRTRSQRCPGFRVFPDTPT